jgi:hypothetical protein
MSIPSKIAASVRNQAANVLRTGQRFKAFDQVRQRHFWSTFRFTPDVNGYIESGEYDYFQVPAGQMGQGFQFPLTLRETNWLGANRVPDNQNLIVTEFGVSALTAWLDTEAGSSDPSNPIFAGYNSFNYPGMENQILDNAVFNIVYLTNQVSLGLCTDFAQASGPTFGFYAPSMPQAYPLPDYDTTVPENTFKIAPTDHNRTLVTNGFPAPSLRRKLKIPLLLQHGEQFRFSLTIPSGRGGFMWPVDQLLTPEEIQTLYAVDVRLEFWATESFVESG